MNKRVQDFNKEVLTNISNLYSCIISIFILAWPVGICLLILFSQHPTDSTEKEIQVMILIASVIISAIWSFVIGIPIIKYLSLFTGDENV